MTATAAPDGTLSSRPPAKPPKPPMFTPAKIRGLIYQVLMLMVVVAVGWYLVDNTATNLTKRNIASGYDFLETPAGFEIGETVIPYDSRCLRPLADASVVQAVSPEALPGLFPDLSADQLRALSPAQVDTLLNRLPRDAEGRPLVRAERVVARQIRGQEQTFLQDDAICDYTQALQVGFWNTIRVSVLGILLATLIGLVVGVARLSSNWLLRRLGDIYVEGLRNIPLLLQLFVWYGVLTVSLPSPRAAMSLGTLSAEGEPSSAALFLSNRGVQTAWPSAHPAWDTALIVLLLGVVLTLALRFFARRRQEATGAQIPVAPVGAALIIGAPLATLLIYAYALGNPPSFDLPTQRGFNFEGGATLTPEFLALLIGLATYTGAFIAEVVRSGILAVAKGQKEAAAALGLRPGVVLTKVVLPQALRIIIPPTTNQYLNLTKNSSLAVAIGYPDLVSIGNTTMNQTGQAIEAVSIFMAVYLILSILISVFMNWYNSRIALKER